MFIYYNIIGNAELIAECLDILPKLENDYPYFLNDKSLSEIIPTLENNYG